MDLVTAKRATRCIIRTYNIKLSNKKKLTRASNNVSYTITNINVTYSTLNAQKMNKRVALVDRGAKGGIAGSDTRVINTHPTKASTTIVYLIYQSLL